MSPRSLQSNWPNRGNTVDYAKLAKTGWLKDGILVVNRNDESLPWHIRHMVDEIGDAIHGERTK